MEIIVIILNTKFSTVAKLLRSTATTIDIKSLYRAAVRDLKLSFEQDKHIIITEHKFMKI